MGAALKALAEARHLQILRLVWLQELPATDIAHHFRDVARPSISQHLAMLTEALLVIERREVPPTERVVSRWSTRSVRRPHGVLGS